MTGRCCFISFLFVCVSATLLTIDRLKHTRVPRNLNYREFLEIVRDPDAKLEDVDDSNSGGGMVSGSRAT